MNTYDSIKTLFSNSWKNNNELHALTIYKGQRCIFSGGVSPFTPFQKNHVYSISKSFCSTAFGIAIDKGILSLDDKIIDIFPDAVENPDKHAKMLTLRHVLSMNTGHASCVMTKMIASDNPVKAFFEVPLEYQPGTHFAYNTGATFLASICLTKKTGLSLIDFLERNLFRYMDINGSEWFKSRGYCEGGVGFNVSCDDLAKLGVLYLFKGVYNGKRLLSESFVSLATSPISDNSSNGSPDWCSGYGLQFWVNRIEGFRGDGAFGQYCIVYPKYNLVISAISESSDMQKAMDDFLEFAKNLDEEVEFVDSDSCDYLKTHYVPGSLECQSPLFGNMYSFEHNTSGFNSARIEKHKNGIRITLCIDEKANVIDLLPNEWTRGTLLGRRCFPTLDSFTERQDRPLLYSACASVLENGGIKVTLYCENCPHRIMLEFNPTENGLLLNKKHTSNNGYNEAIEGTKI